MRAIRRIRKGEEVLASYINHYDQFPTTLRRRLVLEKEWNFRCSCSLCSSDHEENDFLRTRVQELHDEIPRLIQQGNVPDAARAAHQKCQILEKCEDMAGFLAVAYLELYELLISVAKNRMVICNFDPQIANLSDTREEYREKAYELCKNSRLIQRKAMYNKKIRKFASCQQTDINLI